MKRGQNQIKVKQLNMMSNCYFCENEIWVHNENDANIQN